MIGTAQNGKYDKVQAFGLKTNKNIETTLNPACKYRTTGDPFEVMYELEKSVALPDFSKVRDGMGPVILAGEGDITELNEVLFRNNEARKKALKFRPKTSEEIRVEKQKRNKEFKAWGLPSCAWAWVSGWEWQTDNWGNRRVFMYFSLVDKSGKSGYYCQQWGERDEHKFLSIMNRWGINHGGHLVPVFWNESRASYRVDTRKKPLISR